MTAAAPQPGGIGELTLAEYNALVDAAAWYAQYHGHMIAEEADDPSAMAVARRERFRELHGALRKLGIRLRQPNGL